MKPILFTSLLLSLALPPVAARAEPPRPRGEAAWPITAEGRLAFGVTGAAPADGAFLQGDAALHLGLGRGPFGLGLGVFGVLDRSGSPHETHGVLTWDPAPAARLSLGVPRPAYDTVALSALETVFPAAGTRAAPLTRSQATWGAMFANHLPFGASYTVDLAGARIAASLHRAANVDAGVAGFGARIAAGDWTVSAAAETGTDGFGAKAQALWQDGALRAGIAVFAPAQGSAALEAHAAWDAAPRLTLTGVAQVPLEGGSLSAALSARYAVTGNAGLNAGAASLAGDTAINAFLDWRF